MKVNCKNCGKDLDRIPAIVKKNINQFCNRKCYWNWLKGKPTHKWTIESRLKMSELKMGENNPMWDRVGCKNPAWKGGIAKSN